ncbi:NAD-dependent epimerase [Alicyclobacillus cellulosilyticus]|uniref:NAD-dependent epimerase n=1 Tax=Alicyclobacillus cellulosilyticus TaxID=1003997 RepID=A0A917NK49_9BACL|nr:NAD-dependent epimerase/dehydratase family protein [Alicyclobacillus cellulosilyticus]GGJ06506.1 NAD-dependent epimerase [Alicyclobacillus cellulosilyticus]
MVERTRALVTGGAGFLGSRLVARLTGLGLHVVVIDDLTTGRREAVADIPGVTWVQGSVADGYLMRQWLPHVDYVFHFAARNIVLSVEQPESDFAVNTHATVQLLLGALPYRDRLRRVVYASTSSVYGMSPVLPTPEGGYDVSTPYSASKLAGELFAQAFCKTYGLPVTCLRFSNVYGPGQTSANPYCGVVAKFMQAMLDGEPLTIYGDGTQTRDFTFIDDAMDAVLLAATSAHTVGCSLNVGTGVETAVLHLARLVREVAGKPGHPVVHAAKRKVDTVARRVIDASRLRSLTGWRPRHTLAEGLAATWRWFLAESGAQGGGTA